MARLIELKDNFNQILAEVNSTRAELSNSNWGDLPELKKRAIYRFLRNKLDQLDFIKKKIDYLGTEHPVYLVKISYYINIPEKGVDSLTTRYIILSNIPKQDIKEIILLKLGVGNLETIDIKEIKLGTFMPNDKLEFLTQT